MGFIALFLYSSFTTGSDFTGTDTLASEKISEITGLAKEDFTPIISQWKPPGGEIESLLFALQAAFGGIILGFLFGYWIGQSRRRPEN